MPSIGEIENVVCSMSREEIESNVGALSVINSAYVSEVIGVLAGVCIKAAELGLVQGSLAALTLATLKQALRQEQASLQQCLQLIVNDQANGITVTTPYVYRYMSGSGTGWYVGGRSSIVTY